MFNRSDAGFTLIELVCVITILATLAAFALPRMIGMSQDAQIAVVKKVGGNLGSAVTLIHSKWRSSGNSQRVANAPFVGAGTLDINNAGWPVGTLENPSDSDYNCDHVDDCWGVMDQLLDGNRVVRRNNSNPPGHRVYDGYDFVAEYTGSNETCRYYYQKNPALYIRYRADRGEVSIVTP